MVALFAGCDDVPSYRASEFVEPRSELGKPLKDDGDKSKYEWTLDEDGTFPPNRK